MHTFIDLDEAMNKYYGYGVECFPDHYENVPNGYGGLVTEVTWLSDKEDGKDTVEYIDEEEWSEWACSYFKSCRKAVKIKKTGIVVYDE